MRWNKFKAFRSRSPQPTTLRLQRPCFDIIPNIFPSAPVMNGFVPRNCFHYKNFHHDLLLIFLSLISYWGFYHFLTHPFCPISPPFIVLSLSRLTKHYYTSNIISHRAFVTQYKHGTNSVAYAYTGSLSWNALANIIHPFFSLDYKIIKMINPEAERLEKCHLCCTERTMSLS